MSRGRVQMGPNGSHADEIRRRLHLAVESIPVSLLVPGRSFTIKAGEHGGIVIYDPPARVFCEFPASGAKQFRPESKP